MNEDAIRQIVRDEYNKIATQFGTAKTPFHTHNGIDSPQLPFLAITSPGNNGVLSTGKTSNQTVNTTAQAGTTRPTPYVLPIPIIYNGSAFQGGDATNGSAIMYVKQGVSPTIQIWFRIYDSHNSANKWYGIDFSPGNAMGNAQVLGPIS